MLEWILIILVYWGIPLSILLLYDFYIWRNKRKFLLNFLKEKDNAINDRIQFEKLMKDYSYRTDIGGWKGELIETNKKTQYFTHHIISNVSIITVLFLFLYWMSYWVFLLFFPFIIICVILAWRYRTPRFGLVDYLWLQARGLFVFIINFLVFFINLDSYHRINLFRRTISDTSYHFSMAQLSFSFAIGLFIILTLVSLRDKDRIEEDKLRNQTIGIVQSKKNLDSLTILYDDEEFKQICAKYYRAKLSKYLILGLLLCFIGFILTGIIFLKIMNMPLNNLDVIIFFRPSYLLPDTTVFAILESLILITTALISLLTYKEIVK
jgi:hypothetical protein